MLKYLLEKEFKQLMRNPFMPKLIMFFPLMAMLLFPWAATMTIKNVNIAIVDNSHSTVSQQLTEKIISTGYFKPASFPNSYDKALESVTYGKADVILEIPSDFEENLTKTGVSSIMISANSVDGTKGSLASSYLVSIVSDFATSIQESRSATIQSSMIDIKPYFKFNPGMDYKVFMIPALIVMLLTIICGFLPSLNIVSEKEVGTIEQINVTPISKLMFIAGKLIPYWIIGIIVISIAFAVAYFVYGLAPAGDILSVYLLSFIYILVVSDIGLIISNYSSTMQQAMFVMFFFILILILMSGLFTPVGSMPDWAQWIARFNPLKYFIIIMRSIYLKGSRLSDLLPEIYALLGFFAVFTTWAIASYRKRT
ncbi:MAG: ABC transporter permease [Bacteroidales bacterium]|nr:ABC transporter permease [Bacteroidales bacterium]MDD4669771.1 ABC transporter permease [Bacteroidales bacterium]